MDTWVAVDIGIMESPKTRNLKNLLGLETMRDAAGYAMALFIYAMRVAWRDGDLTAHGIDGIEEACLWRGETGKLVEAFRGCGKTQQDGKRGKGFLDGFTVNDWQERHNRLIKDRLYREEKRAEFMAKRKSKPHSAGAAPAAASGRPTAEELDKRTRELLARRAAQAKA